MIRIVLILVLLTSVSCESIFFDDPSDLSDPLVTYDGFYKQVDRYFSFFEYLPSDFDSAYLSNRMTLKANPTEQQLIETLNEMIQVLRDGHTNIFYGGETLRYTGWYDQFPLNQLSNISDYFQFYSRVNGAMEFGRISGLNIGYIKINTFSGNLPTSNYEEIDAILQQFFDMNGIIIDVRSNGGGNSNNADLVISRFNDDSRLAFRARKRSGSDRNEFENWVDVFTDVYSGDRFLKPVVVLSNRRSFSSTEWFISGMRTIPHVTILGDTTGGGSGNPLFQELPNGWSMRVSNTQKQLPEGRDYQYTGIYPDIPVWITQSDSLNGIDTILERAIELLSE